MHWPFTTTPKKTKAQIIQRNAIQYNTTQGKRNGPKNIYKYYIIILNGREEGRRKCSAERHKQCHERDREEIRAMILDSSEAILAIQI